jgi:hypothetical protein
MEGPSVKIAADAMSGYEHQVIKAVYGDFRTIRKTTYIY